MRSSASIRLASTALLGLFLTVRGAEAQTGVAGIWNLQTRNVAMRATGGVRNVLLKIEDDGGALRAHMLTPLRNQFLDVSDLEVDGTSMVLTFGSYRYDLDVRGDRVTGTVVSPIDTLLVEGNRQEGLMYVGDVPPPYVMTRTGPLGLSDGRVPPEDAADPGAWVRSRAGSVDDLAMVLRGIPVGFSNAAEFEDELLQLAGQRVDVLGEWVGEEYRIHEIALAGPPRR